MIPVTRMILRDTRLHQITAAVFQPKPQLILTKPLGIQNKIVYRIDVSQAKFFIYAGLCAATSKVSR